MAVDPNSSPSFHHDHYDPSDVQEHLLMEVLSQHNVNPDNIWILALAPSFTRQASSMPTKNRATFAGGGECGGRGRPTTAARPRSRVAR